MLANWMFFWNSGDWVQAPVIVPEAVPLPIAGGKKQKRKQYFSPDESFWAVRERYLRRFLPKEPVPVTEPVHSEPETEQPNHTADYEQALETARVSAMQTNELMKLIKYVRQANQIAIDIQLAKEEYYNRAVSVLLLDIF